MNIHFLYSAMTELYIANVWGKRGVSRAIHNMVLGSASSEEAEAEEGVCVSRQLSRLQLRLHRQRPIKEKHQSMG